MAQLALTLAGSAVGGLVGGGFGQGIGALVGAYVGGIIEQELFAKREVVRNEGARVSDFQISGSAYGQTIPHVFGRARLPANIIWMRGIREKQVVEREATGGGGKGESSGSSDQQVVETVTYHYYADVAIAIARGPLTSIYRLWADKKPIDPEHLGEIRLYYGEEDQDPDPLIQAVEGTDRTPAFRGLAYVVLENLWLNPYGARLPNFEVEVFRGSPAGSGDARHLTKNICLIPSSGEWAYDTDIVRDLRRSGPAGAPGSGGAINRNSGQKRSDFKVAIDNLTREIPNVEWISLVYAWFGTSVDVATCAIRPEVEWHLNSWDPRETAPHIWSVMGQERDAWPQVSTFTKPDGSIGLYYGGTIADGAVIRAIQHLKDRGYKVLFYPFIMMDIPPPDPAPFPWRGRISGQAADVPGFFTRSDGYLRFVRHCIDLCEQAGGIDGFAIGSEMRDLNRVHDGSGVYPAVAYWRQIAGEAKAALGSSCLVTYAADWTEYRYHDLGGGNVRFPLDELWGDPNIDVVGIDAYFPITDAPAPVYDKEVLKAGWAGGELFSYFYETAEDRDLARRGFDPQRSLIDDPFYAYKALEYWWANDHRTRVNGIPTGPATDWVPRSKPIWFTEYGFPSVNCAANQPNVFIDPKSSESFAPYYSNWSVDRVQQRAAIEATEEFWVDPANNPVSPIYGDRMVERLFVWTWDARPYPWFPALTRVWSDGTNYRLGHWIQGKVGNMRLSDIVNELCQMAGLEADEFDADDLDDEVVGYVVTERTSVREMIAVLQTAHFFDAVETGGVLVFKKRGTGSIVSIDAEDLGAGEGDGDRSRIRIERTQDTELPIAIDIVHIDEGRDYQSSTATVRKQIGRSESVTTFSLPIVLTIEQAQAIGQRALREIWQGREAFDLKLPTRWLKLDPTDLVDVPVDGVTRRLLVTSVTYGRPGLVLVRGIATDGGVPEFVTVGTGSGELPPSAPEPPAPIRVELLDMPIMIDSHEASASSFYMAACPIGPGRFRGATLFQPTADGLDYIAAATAAAPSVMGATVSELAPGPLWRWDRVNTVEVQLDYGELQSLADERVLAGANAALLGGEIIQFANAELIGESLYRLGRLLRGQRGTEQDMITHPIGSRFVMLDPGRQPRPSFSIARVGIPITWRYAPVPQGPTGDLSDEIVFTDTGNGLRPFAPVHLNAARDSSGDIQLSWTRRTRIGGDSWLNEVPLGEETEEYDVLILNGASVVRTLRVTSQSAAYTAAQQTTDFGSLPATLTWRVAQISRVYGRGLLAEIVSTL
jgi:hypothetical protein